MILESSDSIPFGTVTIAVIKKIICSTHSQMNAANFIKFLFNTQLILLFSFGVQNISVASSFSMIETLQIKAKVKSFKTLRDQHIVKQAFDYSCGAAALATLLTFGFNDVTTEQEVLISAFDELSKDQERLRKKQGLSLLDLKQVAKAKGYRAKGFRILPEHLSKLNGPVLVNIKPRGYEHFSVLKGAHGDYYYLADPARGNWRVPGYQFLNMWLDGKDKGIIFVIEPKSSKALDSYPLKLDKKNDNALELLSIRQLMQVGNPYLRFPIRRRKK